MGKKSKKSKNDEIFDMIEEVQEKIRDSGGASLIIVTPDFKKSVCSTAGEIEPITQMLVSLLDQNEGFRALIANALNHKGADFMKKVQDDEPHTKA